GRGTVVVARLRVGTDQLGGFGALRLRRAAAHLVGVEHRRDGFDRFGVADGGDGPGLLGATGVVPGVVVVGPGAAPLGVDVLVGLAVGVVGTAVHPVVVGAVLAVVEHPAFVDVKSVPVVPVVVRVRAVPLLVLGTVVVTPVVEHAPLAGDLEVLGPVGEVEVVALLAVRAVGAVGVVGTAALAVAGEAVPFGPVRFGLVPVAGVGAAVGPGQRGRAACGERLVGVPEGVVAARPARHGVAGPERGLGDAAEIGLTGRESRLEVPDLLPCRSNQKDPGQEGAQHESDRAEHPDLPENGHWCGVLPQGARATR